MVLRNSVGLFVPTSLVQLVSFILRKQRGSIQTYSRRTTKPVENIPYTNDPARIAAKKLATGRHCDLLLVAFSTAGGIPLEIASPKTPRARRFSNRNDYGEGRLNRYSE